MRRRYWRFSRPLGSLVCVLLLLLLAWVLRLTLGAPPQGPEALLRRTERRMLRPPGELVEIVESQNNYATAVTWREGELYTYTLMPVDSDSQKRWTHRYTVGMPYRDTVHDSDWGCCTFPTNRFDIYNGKSVLNSSFYALVRVTDPQIRSGKLTVETVSEEFSRTWTSQAERGNPYYLAFELKLWGGSEAMREHFYAMHSGYEGVSAEAEAVFYDAEGREVSRMRFSMAGSEDEERSMDHGA